MVVSCGAPPTEILVVVDSELVAPTAVDRLELKVIRQRDDLAVVTAIADLAGPNAKAFPVTFSLERAGGDPGPLAFTITAKRAGQAVLLRQARDVAFVPNEIMMLRLDLLARCRDEATCPAPPPLARWEGTPKPWAFDAGVQPGVDAAAPPLDAASADAAVAADAGPLMCVSPCEQECNAASQCKTECPLDGDCSLVCSDDGTTCDLNAQASKATSVSCKKRARCTMLAAKKTKEGRLVCEDDAWCDLLCESPSCQLDCRNAQCRLRTTTAGATTRVSCTKGANCTLDFGAGDDIDVVCTGATCSVMCRGGAQCDVKCNGGSSCLLSCETSGSCALTNCPKAMARTCGSGVFVCGRECP